MLSITPPNMSLQKAKRYCTKKVNVCGENKCFFAKESMATTEQGLQTSMEIPSVW